MKIIATRKSNDIANPKLKVFEFFIDGHGWLEITKESGVPVFEEIDFAYKDELKAEKELTNLYQSIKKYKNSHFNIYTKIFEPLFNQ